VVCLGSWLIDPSNAGALVRSALTSDMFYDTRHQKLFLEIGAVQDKHGTVDPVLLSQHLTDINALDQVGGVTYISDLFLRVPTATTVGHHAAIVRDRYLLRQLIGAAAETADQCYSHEGKIADVLDQVEKRFFGITADAVGNATITARQSVSTWLADLEKREAHPGTVLGVPIGYAELDRIVGGCRDQEMIVVAARTSVGKTAFALNVAEKAALDHRIPTGIFSLEMSHQQLTARLIALRARVNLRDVLDGTLSEDIDLPQAIAGASEIAKAPLYLDETSGITIHQLRARARRWVSQLGVKLIIVDYLQLVRAPSKRGDFQRQVEVSDVSAGIKGLAKELNVPVIVLAQLNRDTEKRKNRVPQLSDLRESGSIEQDADKVILLHRPELDVDDETSAADAGIQGMVDVIVAKNRNGPCGTLRMRYIKESTRFEPLEVEK
jgi:replicative DNA helicase